jgi:hypothetical protein
MVDGVHLRPYSAGVGLAAVGGRGQTTANCNQDCVARMVAMALSSKLNSPAGARH